MTGWVLGLAACARSGPAVPPAPPAPVEAPPPPGVLTQGGKYRVRVEGAVPGLVVVVRTPDDQVVQDAVVAVVVDGEG